LILLATPGLVRADGLPDLSSLGVPADLTAALTGVRQAAGQDDAHAEWAAAADAIAGDLERLYGGGASDASVQSEALAGLAASLEKIDGALSDPKNVAIADPLTSLSGRLHRRVDVLTTALALIESSQPASDDDLQKDREAIAEKVAALDAYLEGHSQAEAWKAFLGLPTIQAALDGGVTPDRAVLAAAAARLNPAGRSKVHQEVLGRPAFADLGSALSHLAGDLQSRDPAASEGLRGQVGELITHLDAYERGGAQEHVAAVRDLARQLEASGHNAAGSLAEQIDTYYLDHNLRVVVSEQLLQKSIEADKTDSGPVRDYILGADVFGDQVTNSRVGVRLHPDKKAASYVVSVRGRSNSDTEGYRGNAVIYTHSTSDFVAERRFQMTGEGMRAGDVRISVDSRNETQGADTSMGWVPLLGGLARGMAYSGAERRRPEAEAIAASRVRSRVVPEMTREGDSRIAEFNRRYHTRLRDPLAAQGLFPDPLETSSTRTHIFAKGTLARENEFGGHYPKLWVPGGSLGVLQIHQSALNNVADRFELAGKTLDKPAFGQLLAERLGELLPKAVPETAGEPGPQEGTVSFPATDPVRIRFEDGLIRVTLRAESFQSSLLNVPGSIISASYRPVVEGETVRFVREGAITVRPLNEPKTDQERAQALAFSIALQASFSNLFRDAFDTPAAYTFDDEEGRVHTLNIVQVKVLDGWLSLAFR
jgi:hypothetical protein